MNNARALFSFIFYRSRGLDVSFNLDEDKENMESIDMVKHIQTKVEEMDVSSFVIRTQ